MLQLLLLGQIAVVNDGILLPRKGEAMRTSKKLGIGGCQRKLPSLSLGTYPLPQGIVQAPILTWLYTTSPLVWNLYQMCTPPRQPTHQKT